MNQDKLKEIEEDVCFCCGKKSKGSFIIYKKTLVEINEGKRLQEEYKWVCNKCNHTNIIRKIKGGINEQIL